MKIRHGFVSNSSTTSFCIYGAGGENLDCEDGIDEIIYVFNKMDDNKFQEFVEYANKSSLSDELKEKFAKKNFDEELICYIDSDYGYFFKGCHNHGYDYYSGFGKSWAKIGDDQTGKQFKEEIEDVVKLFLGEDKKCSTIEEAWHDG